MHGLWAINPQKSDHLWVIIRCECSLKRLNQTQLNANNYLRWPWQFQSTIPERKDYRLLANSPSTNVWHQS